MAMSVGSGDGEDDRPMSDINTTPLVDVMLVLLIIFLITVPVVIQTVPLQLPQVVNEPTTTKPENVALSVREVNGQCETYWGVQRVPDKKTLLDRGVGALRAEIERQEAMRSEEHKYEIQSLMRISYAVICLKKKNNTSNTDKRTY